jgi:hypothetical protein
MNDEIRKQQIQTIIREAQYKVNSLCSGFKVVLLESERTESDVQSDVRKALRDREAVGLSAANNLEETAPLTLDGVSQSDRKLIEQAVEDMRAVENFEK